MLILELILLLALIGVDILTKYIVVDWISEGSRVIIPDILTFIYQKNYGASFGIFAGKPVLLLIISITASLALFIFLILNRKAHKFLRLSLILILSGAIGNIFDRIAFGYVRDFIDYTFLMTWFNINFAVCNVADIFLTIGSLMLIIYVIFIYKEKPKVMVAKPSRKKKKKGGTVSEAAEEEAVEEQRLLDLSGKDNFQSYDDKGSSISFDNVKGIVKKAETAVRNSDDTD